MKKAKKVLKARVLYLKENDDGTLDDWIENGQKWYGYQQLSAFIMTLDALIIDSVTKAKILKITEDEYRM